MGSPTNIQRWSLKAQAVIGVAETAWTTAEYLDVQGHLPKLAREALQAAVNRGGWHANQIVAGSKEGGELQLEGPLGGWSLNATPLANPTELNHILLWKSMLGACSIAGYKTDGTGGGATTTYTWTAAPAIIGHAVNYPSNGTPGRTTRAIGWGKSLAANTITWAAAGGEQGGAGSTYGSVTTYLTTASRTPLSLQFLGGHASLAVVFYDAIVTKIGVKAKARKQPMATYTLKYGGWTIIGTGNPGQYAPTYPQLPHLVGPNGARFLLGGVEQQLGDVELELTQSVVVADFFGGTEGHAFYDSTNVDVAVKVTQLVTNLATQVRAPGALDGVLQLDLCTTPGRSFSFLLPVAQVKTQNEIKDAGGVVALETTYEPGLYVADASSAGPGNSAARAAFM